MTHNGHISQFQPYTTSDLPPLDEAFVFVFNPITKEGRIISWGDFHKVFGLNGENVGINNTNPQYNLDISGDARIIGDLLVGSGLTVGTNSMFAAPNTLAVSGDLGISGKLYSIQSTGTYINVSGENKVQIFVDSKNFYEVFKGDDDRYYLWFNPSGYNIDFNIGTSGSGTAHPYPQYTLHIDGETSRVGFGTPSPQAKIHGYGKNFAFGTGASINGDINAVAFLDGRVSGELGIAFQSGFASGSGAIAFQKGTALGNWSYADGFQTTSIGSYSSAHNYQTLASGFASVARNYETTGIGDYSTAEGYRTISKGMGSHAEGGFSQTVGSYSHAEGRYTISYGLYSHAEGDSSYSVGAASHAEGSLTYAYGAASHAEGSRTRTEQNYSHAEGYNSVAGGVGSHAEGYQTRATGSYSHSEGYKTFATGYSSHAAGYESCARQRAEYALSAGNFEYVGDAQTMVLNTMLSQNSYTWKEKYYMTVGNVADEHIKLQDNAMYNVKVFMNGRGAILSTQRIAGSSVSWGYKWDAKVSTKTGLGGMACPILNESPYLLSWPASPIYGDTMPANEYSNMEQYFMTDEHKMMLPSEYNEIEGFAPFMELDTATNQLKMGVCRTGDWAYYEVGAIDIVSNSVPATPSDYYLVLPSVLLPIKNANVSGLFFKDISGIASKDTGYFWNTYEFRLDTGYELSGVLAAAPVAAFTILSGTGPTGMQSTSDPGEIHYSGVCLSIRSLDVNAVWHAAVVLEKLQSNVVAGA